jgi:hypothetical protein
MKAEMIILDSPESRQILPRSMSVSVKPVAKTASVADLGIRRRFDDASWQASQLRREYRDRPHYTEAIVLEADHAITRFIDHASKRETSRRVIMFPANQHAEPLTIAIEPPKVFEMQPSLKQEAAARLAAMSKRKARPIVAEPVKRQSVSPLNVALAIVSIICMLVTLLR